MEPENDADFSDMLVPEIKIECDSDTSDCENEKKWNADPLTGGTVLNEECMTINKEEDMKIEYSECARDHMTTKEEEEFITGSDNEKVSRMLSGVSSKSNICIIPEQLANISSVSESSNQKLYTCNICNKSLTQKASLIIHLRVHTKERPYTCSICDKHFTQISHLSRHQLTHTNQRMHTCNFCNKSFKEKGHLIAHERIHTNERPFECNICSKQFRERGHLIAHQRIHTKERPFTCNSCNKSFARRIVLKLHHRTHTNERPYKCNNCDKAFTQSGHLSKHQRTHSH